MLLEDPPTQDVNWNLIYEGEFSYHFRPRATIWRFESCQDSGFQMGEAQSWSRLPEQVPRKLSEFLPGLLGCGAWRVWRDNEELSSGDGRTRRALIELAREVVDHR